MKEATSSFSYNAFISYSHSASDRAVATGLEVALQRFAKPWLKRPSVRIFRDTSNLKASSGLWSSIKEALANSRYLILLASPDSAGSPWVAREIEWWRGNRAVDKLILVLLRGEISWNGECNDFDWERTDALTTALAGAFTEEPLYVDVRSTLHERRSLMRHPAGLSAIATISASITGRPRDELVGEDVRQHRRAKRLVTSAAAILGVLLTISIIATNFAVKKQRQAERQLAENQELLGDSLVRSERWTQARAVLREASERYEELGLSSWRLVMNRWEARGRSPQPVLSIDALPAQTTLLAFCPRSMQLALLGPGSGAVLELTRPGSITSLVPPPSNVWSAAMTPDGTRLAVGTHDDEVILFDVQTGGQLTSVTTESRPISLFWPDNDRLIVGCMGGVYLLELQHTDNPRSTKIAEAFASVLEGSGEVLASYEDSFLGAGVLVVRNSRDMTLQATLQHTDRVIAIALSNEGDRIAFASDAGEIWIWDWGTFAQASRVLDGTPSPFAAIRLSADGRVLFAPTASGEILEVEIASGSVRRQLSQLEGEVLDLEVLGPLDALVSLSGNNKLMFWPTDNVPSRQNGAFPHAGILDATIDWEGRIAYLAIADERVTVWDTKQTVPIYEIREPRGNPTHLSLSADRGKVAVVWGDGTCEIRRTMDGELIRRFETKGRTTLDRYSTNVAFSVDQTHLFSLAGHHTTLWRLDDATLVSSRNSEDFRWDGGTASGPRGIVAGLLGTGTEETQKKIGIGILRRESTEMEITPIYGDGGEQTLAVAVDRTWRYAASGTDTGQILLWNLARLRQEKRIGGHATGITALTFTPDGACLIAGDEAGQVRFWSVNDGREVYSRQTAVGGVAFLAFDGAGSTLHVGSRAPGGYEVWRIADVAELQWDVSLRESTGGDDPSPQAPGSSTLEQHFADRGRYRWAAAHSRAVGSASLNSSMLSWLSHSDELILGSELLLQLDSEREHGTRDVPRQPWRKSWALRCLYAALRRLQSVEFPEDDYEAAILDTTVDRTGGPDLTVELTLLDAARRLDDSLTDAHLWASLVSTSSQHVDARFEAIEKAVAQRPQDYLIQLTRAQILLERGSHQEAGAAFDRAIELLRSKITSRLALADKEALESWMRGDGGGQEPEWLRDLDESEIKNEVATSMTEVRYVEALAQSLELRAQVHIIEGQAAQAISALDESLKLVPSGEVYWKRAELHRELGNHESAFRDYVHLSNVASNSRSLRSLLLSAFRLHELTSAEIAAVEPALGAIRDLIALLPGEQEGDQTARAVLMAEGISAADSDRFLAMIRDEGMLFSWMILGFAMKATHPEFGSLAEETDLLELVHTTAYQLFQEGNEEGAKELYSKLVVTAPFSSEYWRGLGATHQQREAYGDAIVAYDLAVTLDPSDLVSLTYRGECKVRSGDLAGGLMDLRRVASMEVPAYAPWIERSKMLIGIHANEAEEPQPPDLEGVVPDDDAIADMNDKCEYYLTVRDYESAARLIVRAVLAGERSGSIEARRSREILIRFYRAIGRHKMADAEQQRSELVLQDASGEWE